MSEQDKVASAANKRGQFHRELLKGGGRDQGGSKWSGNGRKGWHCGEGFGSQQWGKGWQVKSYGTGPFGKGRA